MGPYSVAEAKNQLPSLIDKALEGEEVVITRHGKPVAELRAPRKRDSASAKAALTKLRALRDAGPDLPVSSVELLRQVYEDQ